MLFDVCIIVYEKVLKMQKSTKKKKKSDATKPERMNYWYTQQCGWNAQMSHWTRKDTHTYTLQDSTHVARRLNNGGRSLGGRADQVGPTGAFQGARNLCLHLGLAMRVCMYVKSYPAVHFGCERFMTSYTSAKKLIKVSRRRKVKPSARFGNLL